MVLALEEHGEQGKRQEDPDIGATHTSPAGHCISTGPGRHMCRPYKPTRARRPAPPMIRVREQRRSRYPSNQAAGFRIR